MRYKRLAERIRLAAGVDTCVDLLWGLEPSIPAECRELDEDLCVDESDGCYGRLRRLYCVLDGKNYYECLNRNAALLASYRNGKKIVEGRSAETRILV